MWATYNFIGMNFSLRCIYCNNVYPDKCSTWNVTRPDRSRSTDCAALKLEIYNIKSRESKKKKKIIDVEGRGPYLGVEVVDAMAMF